jgi:hypothetical protein
MSDEPELERLKADKDAAREVWDALLDQAELAEDDYYEAEYAYEAYRENLT